jgi:cytochrome c peroxidase
MRRTGRWFAVALGCLVAVSACTEAPTPLEPDGPSFNKGQEKKKPPPPPPAGDIVGFGELVFGDMNLSVNRNQSCQTCHEPTEGFAAPLRSVRTRGSVVEGSIAGAFGDRKPPSAAYASFSPNFSGGTKASGGNFWDGRATGDSLGSAIADQALGPFLNPVEQALPHEACVVYRVVSNGGRYDGDRSYAAVFPGDPVQLDWFVSDIETRCGDLNSAGPFLAAGADAAAVRRAYENIALALAAFQGSGLVNPFSSRFDLNLRTARQLEGEKLFGSKGKCQQCHDNKGDRPLFTDFEFHNLGVPKNPDNPVIDFADPGSFDPGLGGFTGNARHMGKFRTPTTRNVGLGENRTFMHNGALVNLTQVVDFYNTRDVLPVCTSPEVLADPNQWGSVEFGGAGCWPAPEFGQNLDTKNMGKLGLTTEEVELIVEYLEAMSDGWQPGG